MNISALEKLVIPYVEDLLLPDNQAIVTMLKKEGSFLSIDKINWPEYPYQPVVRLWTAYSETRFWLCYEVENDFFRAKALADQEAVWEDSCVEFFISANEGQENGYFTGDNTRYRNFEFNALGYCLSAYGTREQREPLSSSAMESITRLPDLDLHNLPEEGSHFNWKLVVAIPLDLLGIHPGSTFRANFYKCGDLTRKPHFLSWKSIASESPDFHLPQFFGEAELAV